MLYEMRGRPEEGLLHQSLQGWAFVVPGPDEREVPVQVRRVLLTDGSVQCWQAASVPVRVGRQKRMRHTLHAGALGGAEHHGGSAGRCYESRSIR
ncbi:hypothetical protein Z951_46605 [Streptomyces sp. PRh5]|nr:hypothetical protein Z951_46605 [Streptomyces sp. PRh5]